MKLRHIAQVVSIAGFVSLAACLVASPLAGHAPTEPLLASVPAPDPAPSPSPASADPEAPFTEPPPPLPKRQAQTVQILDVALASASTQEVSPGLPRCLGLFSLGERGLRRPVSQESLLQPIRTSVLGARAPPRLAVI